jgi:hypothetical protein
LLNKLDTLPSSHAVDQQRFQPGHIYVAPPDRHLLLSNGTMRLTLGPRENGFRPRSIRCSGRPSITIARGFGSYSSCAVGGRAQARLGGRPSKSASAQCLSAFAPKRMVISARRIGGDGEREPLVVLALEDKTA